LKWNRLTEIDLSPLQDVDLEILILEGNRLKIIDLSPLSTCYNLSTLDLERNRLLILSTLFYVSHDSKD
jgi:Leucine-rich repeat (LRR) protein